jgi:nucleoside-diphosphate-sugar epimerase
MSTDLHVVLGASGGTGSAVVAELVARGHRVRAVSRSGDADGPGWAEAGVERFAADVSTPEGAKAAADGAAVVYHAAQPAYTRWPQEFPAMNAAVTDGAASAGAKLVFADNLYMYGPRALAGGAKLTEDTPQLATDHKGRTRIEMARHLLAAHAEGRVRVALGRSSDYHGPRGTASLAGDTVMPAVVAGKTARWPAPLDVPHTFSYLPDMARALVTLGERDEADGQVWHLPAAEPLTARRFLQLAFDAAGHPARIARVPALAIRAAALFVPFLREVASVGYQQELPFVVDDSKFQRAFGPFATTPHPEAIAATVAWFRDRQAG